MTTLVFSGGALDGMTKNQDQPYPLGISWQVDVIKDDGHWLQTYKVVAHHGDTFVYRFASQAKVPELRCGVAGCDCEHWDETSR